MDNLITLQVGDWSGDGHCMSDDIIIKSNLNRQEIMEAYNNGVEIMDFDFVGTVCSEYEDDMLLYEHKEILEKHNIHVEYDEEDYLGEDDDDRLLTVSSYVKIWLDITKLGNPNFEYEIFDLPTVDVGGYGLFY